MKPRRPLVEVVWNTLMACAAVMIVVAMAKGWPGTILGFMCLGLGLYLSTIADRKLYRPFAWMRVVLVLMISFFLLMFSKGTCAC